jgi:GNAT superfamily N-acetyltransferase
MDDSILRARLWDGFARLQALLGGHAIGGSVVQLPGLTGSIVPRAIESPTLNAIVIEDVEQAIPQLKDIAALYDRAGVRRWGVWIEGEAQRATAQLRRAGLAMTAGSPGMGATIDELKTANGNGASPADLKTVGKVNDLAYGNRDHRLERTLTPLPPDALIAYRVDKRGRAKSVALALHHGEDCGVSFVATTPDARRQGLAARVMAKALKDAKQAGCTTTTLQATEVGEQLYTALGYHHLCSMQLWERRR